MNEFTTTKAHFLATLRQIIGAIQDNPPGHLWEGIHPLLAKLAASAAALRFPATPLRLGTTDSGNVNGRRNIANFFKTCEPGETDDDSAAVRVYSGVKTRCGFLGDQPPTTDSWERPLTAVDRQRLIAKLKRWQRYAIAMEAPAPTGTKVKVPRATLEKATPPLDPGNGQWVMNKIAAGLEGVQTRTLARYRTDGEKTRNGLWGCDVFGRVWRKAGPNATPFYLRATLQNRR